LWAVHAGISNFTRIIPEVIDVTFNCIDHLQALGKIVLNYSVAESMKFALETWISPEEMKQTLSDISKK
jgi:hypothetical protein